MCGILIYKGSNKSIINRFDQSLSLMSHRGPDNLSTLKVDENTYLGHARLSIIDLLEHSNQPMESDRSILVFNGEIYNYVELRESLISSGVIFNTESDTEVLLRLLETYGQDAVSMLNGMWAFYFYDKKTKKVIVSRDRFGKKPLYYYKSADSYVFSSEIKSIFELIGIDRLLNREFINAFFCYYYWPSVDNRTFYRDIYKVMPGEVITFNNSECSNWTGSDFNVIDNFVDSNESVEDLKSDLHNSVKLRLRADVPVGIFLSGGVDSTAVASYAAMNKDADIRWFTGDTGKGKDLDFSRSVAASLGVHLTELDIAYDGSMLERIKAMTKIYDMPPILLGNSVAMNTLFESVSKTDVKVVLDGTGGDELFGGYFDFYGKYLVNTLIKKGRFFDFINFAKSSRKYGNFSLISLGRYSLIKLLHQFFQLNIYPKSLSLKNISADRVFSSSRAQDFDSINEFSLGDMRYGRLQMWLTMNDSNSMMYSVESRSPLLDYNLLKYQNVSSNKKFNDGFNKYMLRSAIGKNIPSNVTWRRDKQGFRWSSSELIRNNISDIRKSIMDSSLVREVFNDNELTKLFDGNISAGKESIILRLYSLAVFQEVTNSSLA